MNITFLLKNEKNIIMKNLEDKKRKLESIKEKIKKQIVEINDAKDKLKKLKDDYNIK